MTGDKLVKLMGLWVNESKSGTRYLAGRIGDVKVLVMPNRDHDENDDRSPTHVVLLAEAAPRRADGGRS